MYSLYKPFHSSVACDVCVCVILYIYFYMPLAIMSLQVNRIYYAIWIDGNFYPVIDINFEWKSGVSVQPIHTDIIPTNASKWIRWDYTYPQF